MTIKVDMPEIEDVSTMLLALDDPPVIFHWWASAISP